MEYTTRYVVLGETDPCPAAFLKAFVFQQATRPQGPKVFWQTREIILALGLDLRKSPHHKWFNKHEQTMSTLALLLHLPEWTHVLRSTRKQNAALCLDGLLRLIFQSKHSPWPAQWTAPCRAADCSKPVAGIAGQQCSHVHRLQQKVFGAAFPVHTAADLLAEAWRHKTCVWTFAAG